MPIIKLIILFETDEWVKQESCLKFASKDGELLKKRMGFWAKKDNSVKQGYMTVIAKTIKGMHVLV